LLNATIEEIAEGLDKATFTSMQLVRAYRDRIWEVNDHFHAVIELSPDAEDVAEALDLERKKKGRRRQRTNYQLGSVLHGIPVLLKDNIVTFDATETTSGSTVLLGSKSQSEAVFVDELRKAGAIILGKSNLSEFSGFRHTNATTSWSARGGQATGIFWPGQKPSGSSTGSAISVGLGLVTAAFGTETISSLVSPAEKAGVVGFKPTRHSGASQGLVPVSHNLDVVGPMAKTVNDIALIMNAIGPEKKFLGLPTLEDAPLQGIKVGVIFDPEQPVNAYRMEALDRVLEVIESSGADIVYEARLPGLEEYIDLPGRLKALVIETDFKVSVESYLHSLKANPNRLETLNDLIKAIKKDSQEQYPERNTAIMQSASETSTQDPDYVSMLEKEKYYGSDGGIEGALNNLGCDVLISPIGSLNFQRFAAMGKNPVISVPMGVYPENTQIEHDKADNLVTVAPGIPFSLYIYARQWDDKVLLLVAHIVDKSLQIRQSLRPYKTPKVDLKDYIIEKPMREKIWMFSGKW
ncbi:amidase signature enzyme, partial [Hypoxylon sp. EC38]